MYLWKDRTYPELCSIPAGLHVAEPPCGHDVLLQSMSDVQFSGSGSSAGTLNEGTEAANGDSASTYKTDEDISGTTVLGGQIAGLWLSKKDLPFHCTPLVRYFSSYVDGGYPVSWMSVRLLKMAQSLLKKLTKTVKREQYCCSHWYRIQTAVMVWCGCGAASGHLFAGLGLEFDLSSFLLPSSFFLLPSSEFYSFSHVRGSGEPGVFGPLTLTLTLLGLPHSRL